MLVNGGKIQTETLPFGIHDGGQVVGYYGDEQGAAGGFSALAVPEPGAWALLLLGFGGLGVALRGRRHQAVAVTA